MGNLKKMCYSSHNSHLNLVNRSFTHTLIVIIRISDNPSQINLGPLVLCSISIFISMYILLRFYFFNYFKIIILKALFAVQLLTKDKYSKRIKMNITQ